CVPGISPARQPGPLPTRDREDDQTADSRHSPAHTLDPSQLPLQCVEPVHHGLKVWSHPCSPLRGTAVSPLGLLSNVMTVVGDTLAMTMSSPHEIFHVVRRSGRVDASFGRTVPGTCSRLEAS